MIDDKQEKHNIQMHRHEIYPMNSKITYGTDKYKHKSGARKIKHLNKWAVVN